MVTCMGTKRKKELEKGRSLFAGKIILRKGNRQLFYYINYYFPTTFLEPRTMKALSFKGFQGSGGVDGIRTRDLLRDRQAF